MEISFKRSKLQKILSSDTEIKKEFGEEQARFIKRRLAVLKAAQCLSDVPHLPPDRCHELSGELKNHFAVDLKQPYRLLFVPDHEPIPLKKDGGIDLGKITAITIIEIRDYH